MIHNALIVTSFEKHVMKAHKRALKLFNKKLVSKPTKELINGYMHFTVYSTGSKEGWNEAIEHHDLLNTFKDYLDEHEIRYVHVEYGEFGDHIV